MYVVPQDSLPRPDDEELRQMDGEIAALTGQLQKLKEDIKAAESGLSHLFSFCLFSCAHLAFKLAESSLSLEEANDRNMKLQVEVRINEIVERS